MALDKVTTGLIADDAVTLAKMAGGTDGQIITYDASGDPAAVGPGTDGQVITSTGAGSPPAFEAAGVTGIVTSAAGTAITIDSSNNTTLAGTANNLGTVTAGNINVGSVVMKSSDGSVIAMACDTTGRITQPAKPSFKAVMTSGNNVITAGSVIPFQDDSTANKAWDIGGNFNTSDGKFTCPVAGVYFFLLQIYSNNGSSTVSWHTTIENETTSDRIADFMVQTSTGVYGDDIFQVAAHANCAASAVIYCKHHDTTRTYYGAGGSNTSFFSGHLIG